MKNNIQNQLESEDILNKIAWVLEFYDLDRRIEYTNGFAGKTAEEALEEIREILSTGKAYWEKENNADKPRRVVL